ncbi:hypothetical protein IA539_17630 [Gordonia sp. zg691]|uniref:DUF6544 family protein n=1 Tax=Gordonia jinghuaiqii TaxID=2758710 RepID=UPI001662439F|nr:DUF6544 family protein [Gordonia jinghuaiqii]MBD0863008.1 hypothetical protein [Gordonia jinghuaiqii]
MTRTRVPGGARPVSSAWRALEEVHGDDAEFDPSVYAHLPDTAQRWLRSSIAAGSPTAHGVRLSMTGSILLRAWRPFRAEQILLPGRGFIWAARTSMSGLPVTGFDRFTDGQGEMRWKLGGLVPVMSAQGPDVTRSAAGRLAAESVLVPPACVSGVARDMVTWTDIDDSRVGLRWALPGGTTDDITLQVSATGAPERVTMQRWGDPFERGFGRYGFVVELSGQRSFGGISIPTQWAARWEDPRDGTRSEFFRACVDEAGYR